MSNKLIENVGKVKYSEMSLANKHLLMTKLRTLISGNLCYHSVKNLLYSCLLYKNTKVKEISPVVLYGCETWSPSYSKDIRCVRTQY
jgi:hypothetical protein